MNAGLHQMPMAQYVADPCPEPSLSSGIIHTLLTQSPRHAYHKHPRLGGAPAEESETFDIGTAAHAYVLEGAGAFEIIAAPDYRTKAAKEAREAARQGGKVPLLAHRWDDVQAMAEAIREQLRTHHANPTPFTVGKPEQTILWQESGIWCRMRADWLSADCRTLDDLKTAQSANPEVFSRILFQYGYDLQAAWYLRGLRTLGVSGPLQFRFVAAESRPPYAVSVIALAPDALELAERKVRKAIAMWEWCRTRNDWPGYAQDVAYAELPPWQEAQWMERELREEQP